MDYLTYDRINMPITTLFIAFVNLFWNYDVFFDFGHFRNILFPSVLNAPSDSACASTQDEISFSALQLALMWFQKSVDLGYVQLPQ